MNSLNLFTKLDIYSIRKTLSMISQCYIISPLGNCGRAKSMTGYVSQPPHHISIIGMSGNDDAEGREDRNRKNTITEDDPAEDTPVDTEEGNKLINLSPMSYMPGLNLYVVTLLHPAPNLPIKQKYVSEEELMGGREAEEVGKVEEVEKGMKNVSIGESTLGDTTSESVEPGQKRKRQGKRSQEAKARRTAKNNERKRKKRQEEARQRPLNHLPAASTNGLGSEERQGRQPGTQLPGLETAAPQEQATTTPLNPTPSHPLPIPPLLNRTPAPLVLLPQDGRVIQVNLETLKDAKPLAMAALLMWPLRWRGGQQQNKIAVTKWRLWYLPLPTPPQHRPQHLLTFGVVG